MEREGRARWLHPRWCARAGGAAGNAEAGITLLELVIALSVFAILSGSVAAVAGSGLGLARNNRDRSIAANLASEDIDAVNQMSFAALVAQEGSVVTKTRTVGSESYTVKRDVGWQSTQSGTSICSYTAGGSTSSWILGVNTTVTWPAMSTPAAAAVATTAVSPPVGFSPGTNLGSVPVTVRDAAGNPVSGISVSATDGGSNSYSEYTDASGCAFLLVAPSTYTLSLGTANYVDRQGNANPSAVFSISAGSNVAVAFDYDHPGSLVVGASAPDSASAPIGLPTTLAYQFFQPAGTKTYASAGVPPFTVGGLFPDSYKAWFGDCADADPQYWPSGSRISPVSIGSGASAPATVPLGAVRVSLTVGGLASSGATVTAKHDATSGAACPTGSPSTAGYALGTTAADGTLESALPWGRWVLTIVPSGRGATTRSVTIDAGVSGAVNTAVAL